MLQPPNDVEAVRLIGLAAAQGHPGAQCMLASLLVNGDGVAQERKEGGAALRAGGRAGRRARAVSARPLIHAVGKGGMPQDFAEAARLWRLSAAQGHECAREALAELACERAYVSACCMGCGAMRKLKTCAKCKVAKFCGAECQRRTWAEHKSHCKAWAADPPQAAAAVVDAASREATSSAPDAAAGRRRRLPFHDFISARPYGWVGKLDVV
jgi:TPR repeat protein